MSTTAVRTSSTPRTRAARRRFVLRPRSTWLAAALFVAALAAGLGTGYLLNPPA
jgi:hypothetical protein